MMGRRGNRLAATAAMILAACQSASAQSLFSVAADVADIMEILLGMACIIELGVVVVNVMKGERDMVDRGGKWLLITVVIYIVLEVVKKGVAGMAG